MPLSAAVCVYFYLFIWVNVFTYITYSTVQRPVLNHSKCPSTARKPKPTWLSSLSTWPWRIPVSVFLNQHSTSVNLAVIPLATNSLYLSSQGQIFQSPECLPTIPLPTRTSPTFKCTRNKPAPIALENPTLLWLLSSPHLSISCYLG